MLPGDLALVMLGDVMLGRIVDESLALPGQQQAVRPKGRQGGTGRLPVGRAPGWV